MNKLNYKGFIGSVAFSKEDKVFFGKIEGIDVSWHQNMRKNIILYKCYNNIIQLCQRYSYI